MLFRLMLRTGIRVGSALALDVGDVDLDKSELHLRRTKGDRPDVVFLGSEIQKHLRRYLGHREAGPLFPGRAGARITGRHIHRRFRHWLERAGITSRASPHSLRHSFAQRVYARSGDILVVKQALCHRSLASSLIYTRVDEKRLRKVLA
jgi:site-specific recombinase XerC